MLDSAIVCANADNSFSMLDARSGKEMCNEPFTGRQISSLCMSLNGNAVISTDDIEDASFGTERGQLRVWSVRQPPSLQEMFETEHLRTEYEKCAQVTLDACSYFNHGTNFVCFVPASGIPVHAFVGQHSNDILGCPRRWPHAILPQSQSHPEKRNWCFP